MLYYEGSVEAAYDRSFQIDKDVWGCINTFDLKEDGASIKLTNDNRQGRTNMRFRSTIVKSYTMLTTDHTLLLPEFVQLYTDYVLNQSVEKQFWAFRDGFNLVCADSAIKVC